MAKSKKVSVRFSFPLTELTFIHAVKPDMKYGPTYQVTANFNEEQGKQIVAQIEALNPQFKGKVPFREENGTVSFKVKQKRYINWFDKDGKKQERECIPTLLNKDNSPYTAEDNPWGGTTGEVAVTVDLTKDQQQNPVVALRLVGIRFHEVKVGGDGGNDDPLFGGGKPKGDSEAGPSLDQADDGDEFDDDIPF